MLQTTTLVRLVTSKVVRPPGMASLCEALLTEAVTEDMPLSPPLTEEEVRSGLFTCGGVATPALR